MTWSLYTYVARTYILVCMLHIEYQLIRRSRRVPSRLTSRCAKQKYEHLDYSSSGTAFYGDTFPVGRMLLAKIYFRFVSPFYHITPSTS